MSGPISGDDWSHVVALFEAAQRLLMSVIVQHCVQWGLLFPGLRNQQQVGEDKQRLDAVYAMSKRPTWLQVLQREQWTCLAR